MGWLPANFLSAGVLWPGIQIFAREIRWWDFGKDPARIIARREEICAIQKPCARRKESGRQDRGKNCRERKPAAERKVFPRRRRCEPRFRFEVEASRGAFREQLARA